MTDHPKTITVAARIRPFTAKELELQNEVPIVQIPKPGVIRLLCKRQGDFYTRQFIFDHTFWSFDKRTTSLDDSSTFLKPGSPPFADQATVYRTLALPLLQGALEGYNACLFAYGVTSSGKTYSITGPPEDPGIIPRLVDDLFREVASRQCPEVDYSVELSYFEIYNEKIRDLLSSEKGDSNGLSVREHPITGPYVEGLSRMGVRSSTDVLGWLRTGSRNRTVASTEFNNNSSRSHTIFTLYLTRRTVQANHPFNGMIESVYTSQVHIVDLAGSERQGTGRDFNGQFTESCQINKSLFTLGKVISQLSQGRNRSASSQPYPASEPRLRKDRPACAVEFATPTRTVNRKRQAYISYRDSVLTWLLKDSLGGNSMTTILATISPSSVHFEQTLATLNYVKKAQSIVNTAVINEDPRGLIVRQLMAEVARLRAAAATKVEPGSPQAFEVARLRELLCLREAEIRQLSRALQARNHPHMSDAGTFTKPDSPITVWTSQTESEVCHRMFLPTCTHDSTPVRRTNHVCGSTPLRSVLNTSTQVQPDLQDATTQTNDVWICNPDDFHSLNSKTTQLKATLDEALEEKVKLNQLVEEAQLRNQAYEKIISNIVQSLVSRANCLDQLFSTREWNKSVIDKPEISKR